MTKTALRALTVVALSAAVALTTAGPALADTAAPAEQTPVAACDPEAPVATPECPNPWPDTTNVTVCMTEPEKCLPEQVATPAPVQQVAPADPGTAPAELDGEQPAGQPVSTGVQPVQPQPVAAPVLDWAAVWAQISGQLAALFRTLG